MFNFKILIVLFLSFTISSCLTEKVFDEAEDTFYEEGFNKITKILEINDSTIILHGNGRFGRSERLETVNIEVKLTKKRKPINENSDTKIKYFRFYDPYDSLYSLVNCRTKKIEQLSSIFKREIFVTEFKFDPNEFCHYYDINYDSIIVNSHHREFICYNKSEKINNRLFYVLFDNSDKLRIAELKLARVKKYHKPLWLFGLPFSIAGDIVVTPCYLILLAIIYGTGNQIR
jgi:hypothetical protein